MAGAKELKEQSAGISILFAEDEEVLRTSVASILEKFFDTLYVAKDGQEAYEIYQKTPTDIVLTDLNMPFMSGIELIQAIQKIDESAKIIVFTAFNDSRILSKLINLNITQYIQKPLDRVQLISALYKVTSIVNDYKLLAQYEEELHQENNALKRKNDILTQKLNGLAQKTNEVIHLKEVSSNTVSEVSNPTKASDFYASLIQDDVDELYELELDLDGNVALLFINDSSFQCEMGDILSELIRRYGSVLNSYPEFAKVAVALTDLSNILQGGCEMIQKNRENAGTLIESLLFTLQTFRHNVFEARNVDPRFYNASIVADIELVVDFLEGRESTVDSVEFF